MFNGVVELDGTCPGNVCPICVPSLNLQYITVANEVF